MHQIGDIYDAESRFIKGMDRMAVKRIGKTLDAVIADQAHGHILNREQVHYLMGRRQTISLQLQEAQATQQREQSAWSMLSTATAQDRR